MIGCYRLADAGDPQTYSAAVVAVLMRWPPEVIIAVTEPATGIPSKVRWLPSIAEITEACEAAYAPIARARERNQKPLALEGPKVTDEDRRKVAAKMKALADELRAKTREAMRPNWRAPSDDELRAHYGTRETAE